METLKLEEANQRTKEAVELLVSALESGHSEVLTAYLAAMTKFHPYNFRNIMLIARQRSVTYCYTSLESMDMRPYGLLAASAGA